MKPYEKPQKEPIRILLVEDSPTQAEHMRHALETHGYAVTVAVNGMQALEAARSVTPEVIISDIVMPEMDGFEFCKRVKSDEPLKDVPVILMTSLGSPDDVLRGLECGADNFIRKPCEVSYLLSRIEYILTNRALRSNARLGVEMEIVLRGSKHRISPERRQMLDLLISTYEEAVSLNSALREKQLQLEGFAAELERKVEERTAALAAEVAERQQAETRFRTLVEAAPDAIVGVDSRGDIVMVNTETEKLFGYAREEMVGHSVDLLVPQDVREAYRRHREECVQATGIDGARVALELSGRCKDGTVFPAEISLSPLATGYGTLVTIIIRDVSERKRTEKMLRWLATIVESSDDAIVGIDLKGAILSWNRGAVQLFGFTAEEAVGRSGSSLLSQPADWIVALEKVFRGERVRDCESSAVRKDGSRIFVSFSISPILDDRYQLLAISAIVRDVTDHKNLEKQFRQAQKLEAVGRLAGGIAHDFNNLLNVVLGFGELAMERLEQADPVAHHLAQIRQAAERASSLTRQLLAFSRQQVLEPAVLNLNEVVADVVAMLRPVIGEDIELRTNLDADLGRIKADRGQLEQVIVNLVVNSRDAMPRGGKLSISSSNSELDAEYSRHHISHQPGSYVMLAISDTGMGISPEVQARIFEPFFTTKEKGKGTGLGLSTVYGIVKQSGGYIWVYSELGRGTTFKVYFPRVSEAADRVARPTAGAIQNGTETVLLVEDADALRELAREFLTRSGYHVLEASTGEEALRIAERPEETIHVLVTDVVMPGMSGPDLALVLKAQRPDLKVIYASGYAADAIGHHGVLAPDRVLVEKPYSREKLTRKIREVLDLPVSSGPSE